MTLARESAVEAFLVAEVRKRGGMAIKQTGLTGVPDRLVVGPHGQTVFVELKRPKVGKLSMMQLRVIEQLRLRGHKVFVADSKNTVLLALDAIKWAPRDESPTMDTEMVMQWQDEDGAAAIEAAMVHELTDGGRG